MIRGPVYLGKCIQHGVCTTETNMNVLNYHSINIIVNSIAVVKLVVDSL